MNQMDLKTELDSVFAECSAPNWDGYNGEPIGIETLKNAYLFMELLPDWTIAPSIVPEPDGRIGFEWDDSPKNWILASVGPKGILYSIWEESAWRPDWRCRLLDSIPPEILTMLNKHFKLGSLGGPSNSSL